ncbi:hypothetical protein [Methylobacterium nonmethylotrophicum]|uniref:Uncharacterized protein n=1 Tax=Methylobacterium nonmethylotrophicum TaxID=1141884 RepID=A0A4Z0NGJ7_9HYPH|nr:hypothetical protein [Methylobacterium nonmethylotrophicum]TGD94743.1 hypothetical protein EU555_31440 [Methylobacterium nonmethylotrophicum]
MRLLLATALLALTSGFAGAQTEGLSPPLGSTPEGVTAPAAPPGPATGRRQPRRIDGAPPAAARMEANPDAKRDAAAAAASKAQAATAARDKAWDARMKRTLGSICHGC